MLADGARRLPRAGCPIVRAQVSTENKARLATSEEIDQARWARLRKLGKKVTDESCVDAAFVWRLYLWGTTKWFSGKMLYRKRSRNPCCTCRQDPKFP